MRLVAVRVLVVTFVLAVFGLLSLSPTGAQSSGAGSSGCCGGDGSSNNSGSGSTTSSSQAGPPPPAVFGTGGVGQGANNGSSNTSH